jgi:hypothetical protein
MLEFEGFEAAKEQFYMEEMLVRDYAYMIFPFAE